MKNFTHLHSEAATESAIGYVALHVPKEINERLKTLVAPRYPDFRGEHIIIKTGVHHPSPETDALIDNFRNAKVELYGVADDGLAIQCFMARVNGESINPMGKRYHLTWALDTAKDVPESYNADGSPGKVEAKHSGYIAAREEFVKYWSQTSIVTLTLSAKFYPKPSWAAGGGLAL